MHNNLEVADQLKNASSGLLCMSESESPFEFFQWELPQPQDLTPEKVCQQTNHSLDTPVEMVDIDDFFKVATTEQDWQDATEKETVKKYQQLVKILKQSLRHLKVYRLGSRNIDVYIVGQTSSGEWVGLSTQVVET
jgi:hypothetical protein